MVVNDDNTDDIHSVNKDISASRKRKISDSEELNKAETAEEEVSIEEHKTEKKELSRCVHFLQLILSMIRINFTINGIGNLV